MKKILVIGKNGYLANCFKVYMRNKDDYEVELISVTGMINTMEWAADFKNANCTYYYNEVDPELFDEMCRNFDALS